MFLHEDETFFKKFFVVLSFFFAVLNFGGGVTEAANYYISSDSAVDLQNTINAAASGDTIYVAAGTYNLTEYQTTQQEYTARDEYGNEYTDYRTVLVSVGKIHINKSLTLSGGWDNSFTQQTPSATTLKGNYSNDIVAVYPDWYNPVSIDMIISGFTIIGADGNERVTAGVDANECESLTLADCTFKNNATAVAINRGNRELSSNIILTGCTITENGEGVYIGPGSMAVTISGCIITSNDEFGLYSYYNNNQTNVTITDCIIAGNGGDASYHNSCGGLYLSGKTATITNTKITNNYGNGVESWFVGEDVIVTFNSCDVMYNKDAGISIGISNYSDKNTTKITNCNIVSNDSSGVGISRHSHVESLRACSVSP